MGDSGSGTALPSQPGSPTTALQRSLHDLLAKRGIIQEMRSHLRAHLVSLVRNANTGEPLVCKELLNQRLQPKFQALNMLIAEYLLRQEFNYTLSVFSSEIPLEDMKLKFARLLMHKTQEQIRENLHFHESDVKYIINNLGCMCERDGERLSQVYQESSRLPLLVCLMEALAEVADRRATSEYPHSRSMSIDRDRCREHKWECKPIQPTVAVPTESTQFEAEYLNYVSAEKDLVDEMFEHLQSVYDAEAKLSRGHSLDVRLQSDMATYRQLLHEKEKQLEEKYQRRSQAQESKIEERKRFLWRLARSLQEQHAELTKGIQKVHMERELVEKREKNIKDQLKSAEEIFQRNAEEMRSQLTQELSILEKHINTMKLERDNISREREELEKIKLAVPNQPDEVKTEFEDQKRKHVDLEKHYDLLKDELAIVQKYIASTKNVEPKYLVESASLTDVYGIHDAKADEALCDSIRMCMPFETQESKSSVNIQVREQLNNENWNKNQLFNDLKMKNINYMNDAIVQACCEEEIANPTQLTSLANKQSRTERMFQEILSQLREDNTTLRDLATQQQSHIKQLSQDQESLRSELACARRAIDNMSVLQAKIECGHHGLTRQCTVGSLKRSSGTHDAIRSPTSPRHRHHCRGKCDGRRWSHGNPPWRQLSPPCARRAATRTASDNKATYIDTPASPDTEDSAGGSKVTVTLDEDSAQNDSDYTPSEAAGGLDFETCEEVDDDDRDQSPTKELLNAAKIRLRKLEIEANVVEQSYRDFRRRRSSEQLERAADKPVDGGGAYIPIWSSPEKLPYITKDSEPREKYSYQDAKQIKKDITLEPFSKNNRRYEILREKLKEIKEKRQAFLETPLSEFRKLYRANTTITPTANLQRALRMMRFTDSPQRYRSSSSPIKKRSLERNVSKNTHLKFENTSGQKLTEKQLRLLRTNIGKVYSADESLKEKREDILNRLKIFTNTKSELHKVPLAQSQSVPTDYLSNILKKDKVKIEQKEVNVSNALGDIIPGENLIRYTNFEDFETEEKSSHISQKSKTVLDVLEAQSWLNSIGAMKGNLEQSMNKTFENLDIIAKSDEMKSICHDLSTMDTQQMLQKNPMNNVIVYGAPITEIKHTTESKGNDESAGSTRVSSDDSTSTLKDNIDQKAEVITIGNSFQIIDSEVEIGPSVAPTVSNVTKDESENSNNQISIEREIESDPYSRGSDTPGESESYISAKKSDDGMW